MELGVQISQLRERVIAIEDEMILITNLSVKPTKSEDLEVVLERNKFAREAFAKREADSMFSDDIDSEMDEEEDGYNAMYPDQI